MSNLFDNKADNWDEQSIPQQLSRTIGPAIIENIELSPDMEVMDFGAGTGLLTSHIAPLVKSVTAVDISAAMLDRLTAKPELKQKVTACCQDILHEPLDKTFDLVISAMAIHHVKETALLLQRFAEHLKPGGQIALADLDSEDGSFHPPQTQGVFHLGFDRETFSLFLHQAGFEAIRFLTAHIVEKDGTDFPVFLVLANKKKAA
jgi:putative AdoMet-dependent methyltransferase